LALAVESHERSFVGIGDAESLRLQLGDLLQVAVVLGHDSRV
jgi:hypothetical protein